MMVPVISLSPDDSTFILDMTVFVRFGGMEVLQAPGVSCVIAVVTV